jgi:Na+/H+ antiporter NhaD/arsenite permease-like protein
VDWQSGTAAAVFAASFVMLALGRFGGTSIPRGLTALIGGLVTSLLLQVSWRVIDLQVILLIASLMALAGMAEEAGLFAGLRRRLAKQPPWRALWFSTLLVAVTSAALLNDAAVVILVPFLLPSLLAWGLPGVPSVILLAVAANVGSLLTPFGNPQNAVLARAGGLSVLSFLIAQGPLVILGCGALGIASYVAARHLAHQVREPPAPIRAVGRPWLLASVALFLVAAASGQMALGTAAATATAIAYLGLRPVLGSAATRGLARGLDWNVAALFAGLYLLTGGLQSWFPSDFLSVAQLDSPAEATAIVTVLSNTVGNVPAMLAFLRLDAEWTAQHAAFLVSTSTLGGSLLLIGSAASLLAADQAKRFGLEIGFWRYAWMAIPIGLPLLLLGAWLNW